MILKKTVISLIIAFLLIIYCYVFYLARHPDVTPGYRAYYIDRTTTLSPTELKRIAPYRAGAAVAHTGSSILLFEGWSSAEETHRWSSGGKSQLVFYVEDAESFAGEIRLNCFYFDSQRIAVDINKEVVATFTGTGEELSRIVLFNPKLLKEKSLNSIGFTFSDARSPDPRDKRLLAMALREVTVF